MGTEQYPAITGSGRMVPWTPMEQTRRIVSGLLGGGRHKPMTDKQFEAAIGLTLTEREIPGPVIREEVSARPKPLPRFQQPPLAPSQPSGLRSYL